MPETNNTLLHSELERALSLVRAFGNAVFITQSRKQAEELSFEVFAQLNISGVKTDAHGLPDCLARAGGKDGLIVNAIDEVVKDERAVLALAEAVKKRSTPIIGITDLKGFRELEKRPQLSGFLQFILINEIAPGTRRNKSVLIIGATSLFGNAVYRLFSREYSDVKGTGFSKAAKLGFDKLDTTSREEIKNYFSLHPDFDIVIYIAGEANAEVAEKEKERWRIFLHWLHVKYQIPTVNFNAFTTCDMWKRLR